jgi:hypothetical protein
MMRRKLGILFLAGVTVLAGTQEARRQFDGLRSSVKDLTRASLWSGLIVYAQPVSDGKLPAPQIYYLTPQPQTSPASPQEPMLVDNRNSDANNNSAAGKTEAKNNHGADEIAANTDALLPLAREVEDAAKSELVLDKMASHVVVASRHLAANARKLDKVRVYEEVASNVSGARKFKHDADAVAKVVVKEFDAAKLEAEITRLSAAHEQLENLKLKSFGDAAAFARRLELKAIRRAPRPERPERHRMIAPYADRRAIILPEISSIGCEATTNAEESAIAAVETTIETTVVVAGLAASVRLASEPLAAVEVVAAPAAVVAPLPASTSWALGCDTEPEFTK